eukprot:gene17096-23524_t
MPSFGVALAFVEEKTNEMKSVTLHLGRRPTPLSSPSRIKNNLDSDDCEDLAERFDNVKLDEVVIDQNDNFLIEQIAKRVNDEVRLVRKLGASKQ